MSKVVTRVTIGGTADSALGIQLHPDYDEPMLPAPRERYVEVPGRAGRHEFDGDIGPRMLNLRFVIVDATTRAGLQSLVRDLTDLLIDDDGHPTDTTIVFDDESTLTYTARYAGRVPIDRLVAGTVGEFTLPMLCHDPYAYGAEDSDSFTITAASQEEDVENAGDFKTPVTITLGVNSGTITGFTLLCRKLKT